MTLDPSDRFLDVRRQRTRDQMDHLQGAHRDRGTPIIYDTGDPADFNFMCASDHVLLPARDPEAPPEDPDNPDSGDPVDQLRAYFGSNSDKFKRVPPQPTERRPGLARRFVVPARRKRARVPGRPDLLVTLDEIDHDMGVGFAVPDHVVHICSQSSICPATEPAETGFTASATAPAETRAPWPKNDQDAGGGILVWVVDTGWFNPTNDANASVNAIPWPWLKTSVTGDPEPDGIRDAAGHIRVYAGHGTFVAGVVRAMASKCRIRVLRLTDDRTLLGGGVIESQLVADLDKALHRPKQKTPHVINLSAGCTTRLNLPSRSFEEWWKEVQREGLDQDMILVAAAGNNASPWHFWPASFDWAVGVGSLDRDGQISDFSNWGDSADVFALGRNIVNAFPNGTYVCHETPDRGDVRVFRNWLARWSGTSFSTPLVTGLIAAAMKGPQGGMTARQAAEHVLRTTSQPLNQPKSWSLEAREVPIVAEGFLQPQL